MTDKAEPFCPRQCKMWKPVLSKSLRQEDMAEGFLQWSGDDHQGFGMTETQQMFLYK